MLSFASVLFLFAAFSQGGDQSPRVTACLARHPEVTLNRLQKPPYLRIFFDTSDKPDYVIAVKEKGSNLNRMLVCTHDDKDVILGSKADKKAFSDVQNDDYLSSKWRVCSKKDVRELRNYYERLPEPANEAICLLWEDGEALIYSDRQQFRWKSLKP